MYLYYLGTDPYTFNTTTNLYKASQNNVVNSAEAFSGGTTWIGSDNYNNGNTFDGSIDEVAVFTNALSEAQIQALFLRSLGLTSGIPPVFTSPPPNTQVFMGRDVRADRHCQRDSGPVVPMAGVERHGLVESGHGRGPNAQCRDADVFQLHEFDADQLPMHCNEFVWGGDERSGVGVHHSVEPI